LIKDKKTMGKAGGKQNKTTAFCWGLGYLRCPYRIVDSTVSHHSWQLAIGQLK
jgi:hypothetical protein